MSDTTFVIVITLIGIGGVLGLAGMIIRAINRHLDRRERMAAAATEGATGVREELDLLRHRVVQLEERVDFTERMLAQANERERLAPGA